MPLGELGARAIELPEEAEVIVACRSGGRSMAAATALAAAGWHAANLIGGMLAWAAAGLPLVGEPGEAAIVV